MRQMKHIINRPEKGSFACLRESHTNNGEWYHE